MSKNMQPVSKAFMTRRILLIVLIVILALILVALVAFTIIVGDLLGSTRDVDNSRMDASEYQEFLDNQDETVDPEYTGVTMNPDDVEWGDGSFEILPHGNVINILLIGQDRREGQGRQRSDAMILCTLNYDEKTIVLTSFMRDMYVKIPGYDANRINACYQIGGMELLDECLLENFGVQVDGNIEVDFGGFMSVIDAIGGVDMELTQAEANYLNRWGNWDVSDTAWTWDLKEGMNHMTGEQALAYSRIREIGNSDFGRTERQRKVLTALLDACSGKSVGELYDMLKELMPLMATDMKDNELVSFAVDAFSIVSDIEIETMRIPADGTFQDASIHGMQVLVPDLEANRELLKDVLS